MSSFPSRLYSDNSAFELPDLVGVQRHSYSSFVNGKDSSLSTRYSTISLWPYRAAECSGVHPYLFFALTSAPFSTRYLTISLWPYWAAKCSGVCSSLSFALTKIFFLVRIAFYKGLDNF